MKAFSIAIVATLLAFSAPLYAQGENMQDIIQKAAPALGKYTDESLLGDVWKRPGLSPRDRSIVTLAALVARNQTIELPHYLALALDSGVKPAEISELITHLAFYSGWSNAVAAAAAAARRGSADSLARPSPASSATRPTCCLRISGCGRTLHRGTGAW